MIVGIGSDIVEHKVSRSLNWDKNPKILERIFSENEIEIYLKKNDLKFLSGRFAVKEAVLKCLGTGMYDGISLKDIQVLQSENMRPKIELSGKIKGLSEELGINMWHVSISHSNSYSIAFVIAENN